MKQATLELEPSPATTRPLRVTTPSANEPAGAAPLTPVRAAEPLPRQTASRSRKSEAEQGVQLSRPEPASIDEPPTKAPAGPRSKAARIIALARALGVQSDAESAGQLGVDAPF